MPDGHKPSATGFFYPKNHIIRHAACTSLTIQHLLFFPSLLFGREQKLPGLPTLHWFKK